MKTIAGETHFLKKVKHDMIRYNANKGACKYVPRGTKGTQKLHLLFRTQVPGDISRCPFVRSLRIVLGCDILLMNWIDLTKLVARLFLRIARVGPFRSSIHDILGLNTEPMDLAVGGSHLYSAQHTKNGCK